MSGVRKSGSPVTSPRVGRKCLSCWKDFVIHADAGLDMLHAIDSTRLRPDTRMVIIACLVILAFGVYVVASGRAEDSALLGLAVLDGLILALFTLFRGTVDQDVAGLAVEIGATTRRSAWQTAAHWLTILVFGIVTVDIVSQGLAGAMRPMRGGGLALGGGLTNSPFGVAPRTVRVPQMVVSL